MEQKKSFPLAAVIVIGLVLALAHLFLFPRETRPTGSWRAESAVELTVARPDFPLNPAGEFFQYGSSLGYIDPEGGVPLWQQTSGVLSGNSALALTFDPALGTGWIFDRNGISETSAAFVPFVRHSYLFALEENQLGFSMVDRQGKRLWSRSRAAMMTAVEAGQGVIAAGDLSGVVELYDASGSILTRYQPGGSRLEVIYQLAVSPDGSQVLVVSGMEPKRLVVLEKGTQEYIPIEHETMEDARRFPGELRFLSTGLFAFTDQDGDRLQIRRVRSGWRILHPIQGNIAYLGYDGKEEVFDLVTFFQGYLLWTRLTEEGTIASEIGMPASASWAVRYGDSFFYARDGKLMRLRRGRL